MLASFRMARAQYPALDGQRALQQRDAFSTLHRVREGIQAQGYRRAVLATCRFLLGKCTSIEGCGARPIPGPRMEIAQGRQRSRGETGIPAQSCALPQWIRVTRLGNGSQFHHIGQGLRRG